MDMEFIGMIFKTIFTLALVLLLLYLSLKLGGEKLQNGKYIKVLERVPLSKENFVCVVKIGEKAYIMTSTPHSIEKITELSKDDTEKIENLKIQSIPQYSGLKEFLEKKELNKIYDKLKLNKLKKEDKYEEKK
ncbi:flagellar biosynthetic protein FliO [Clostridium sporogenes]|uniref:Flagellar protein n=1 Tax=Clostridium sporogenes TaxID=1509 RepID=A0A7X5P6B5_CLOSG|nr:flagellar biosynthetic protein FliO [Clostridium sporogenes]AJD29986.1 flagellar biosynthetic protein FliO [Clostridium botulinum Prevot_594]EHN14004.1 flagellar biosynthesis domain-containing protein [Clostridium sporogenes PA 3679]KRU43273.1 flagellar biosynthesis protein FliO [Clostridium sporogenes]MBA4507819.1 flagellar biosynthetic protein FliO [Clostridium sporogenes]MBY7014143.1 flagellar biosynthetic protein FliO [Clostridium sporogenes]